MAQADCGRHRGYSSFNVHVGGLGSLALSFGLRPVAQVRTLGRQLRVAVSWLSIPQKCIVDWLTQPLLPVAASRSVIFSSRKEFAHVPQIMAARLGLPARSLCACLRQTSEARKLPLGAGSSGRPFDSEQARQRPEVVEGRPLFGMALGQTTWPVTRSTGLGTRFPHPATPSSSTRPAASRQLLTLPSRVQLLAWRSMRPTPAPSTWSKPSVLPAASSKAAAPSPTPRT